MQREYVCLKQELANVRSHSVEEMAKLKVYIYSMHVGRPSDFLLQSMLFSVLAPVVVILPVSMIESLPFSIY